MGTVPSMAGVNTRLDIGVLQDGLSLVGDLDGRSIERFTEALDARVAAGGFVRLDMRGVTSLDDGALRALVAATGRSRSGDADVVLDAPSPEIAHRLRVSGLAWLLTVINVGAAHGLPDAAAWAVS